jgi:hypothetical protein
MSPGHGFGSRGDPNLLELERGGRGFAARGPAGRTPTPAPPPKGEGFICKEP